MNLKGIATEKRVAERHFFLFQRHSGKKPEDKWPRAAAQQAKRAEDEEAQKSGSGKTGLGNKPQESAREGEQTSEWKQQNPLMETTITMQQFVAATC